jgi:hypothetical protein
VAGGVSISYFVRYDISTADLAGFVERYRTKHQAMSSDEVCKNG